MFKTIVPNLTIALCLVGILSFLPACAGNETREDESDATAQDDAHEHGDATHTHDPAAEDTTGMDVDDSGTFFDSDSTEQHEHGDDTHTHD